MATNVGIEGGHPYLEAGADGADLSLVSGRVMVTTNAAHAEVFTLERSVDGGVTWEQVLAEVLAGAGANLVDRESLSYGDTLYRAVSFTIEGATAETTIVVPARSGALWLSGGPAYGLTCRLPLNPSVKHSGGRARALKEYAGREKPVALVGEMTSRQVVVVGRVTDGDWVEETASVDDLLDVAHLPHRLFLFRDPDGRRLYGTMSDVDLDRMLALRESNGDRPWNGMWGYSFTFTEAT